MTQFLTRTELTVIYSMPQGKPNTDFPLRRGEVDDRPRVAQAPQKGPTCTYYVLAMLRRRFGARSTDFPEERRVEQICSAFRKEITSLNASHTQCEFKILKEHMDNLSLEPDLDEMQIYSPVLLESLAMGHFDRISTIVRSFVLQTEYHDLYQYYTHQFLEPWERAHIKFFEALGVNPEEIYLADKRSQVAAKLTDDLENSLILAEAIDDHIAERYPPWPIFLRSNPSILNAYAFKVMAEAYGFRVSSWTPSQPITSLKACMEKKEGPLIVGGKFGKKHFISEPSEKQILEGRFIYGWNSERTVRSSLFLSTGKRTCHAVKVIGASLEGGGLVYFVDTNDGSDPDNPEQQKIYTISYQSFISRINDLRNVNSSSQKRDSPFGYALYYPPS